MQGQLTDSLVFNIRSVAPDIGKRVQVYFFGVASQLMRRILVDHARKRQADKRAGQKVSLESALGFQPVGNRDLLALDHGLATLEKIDPRKCRAVELRYRFIESTLRRAELHKDFAESHDTANPLSWDRSIPHSGSMF